MRTVFLFLLLLIASCHIYEPKGELNGYSPKVQAIVSERCFSCHAGGNAEGDFGTIADANKLIGQGYIIPGSPTTSLLYKKITNPPFGALMPYGGPDLTSKEISEIYKWIAEMEATDSSCVPNIVGGNPSFANDVMPLLKNPLPQNPGGSACIQCHNQSGGARTRFVMSATNASNPIYANFFSSTHCANNAAGVPANVACAPFAGPMIVPGNPCNSRLYMRLSQSSGPDTPWAMMPKGAANPNKMTSAQLGIIYTWILNGAPNN